MGFREVVLVGFVLLVSGGDVGAAAQSQLGPSANESWAQVPQESSEAPPTTAHQSNRTEPVRFPSSYRLKAFQLRRPTAAEPEPAQAPNLAGAESEAALNPGEAVRAGELKSLIPGPDLSPPAEPEPQVPPSSPLP